MGKSCSDFFSLAARDLRPLVLPPPLIWGRNVQITVLGADCSGGKMIRGLLGVVVVVDFLIRHLGLGS